eukprot:TRINITY_DN2932_c0_g1_i12.p1 TRINITY_DN2932_c0_g1~~TRINITY_DN2932_c0_g1_i12.p1  ORF type:complete len:125 (+),score=11.78 TRINITY_DN2932_c0_g1_i12:603-977(+)
MGPMEKSLTFFYLDCIFASESALPFILPAKSLNPFSLSDHVPFTFSIFPLVFLPKRSFLPTHWHMSVDSIPPVQLLSSSFKGNNVQDWLKLKNVLIQLILERSGKPKRQQAEPLTDPNGRNLHK